MTEAFAYLAALFVNPVTWWTANPVRAAVALCLIAVIIGVAIALTVSEIQHRNHQVAADDKLLDRLGSAAPGKPETKLDELADAWIKDVEAEAVNDIDTDTALAAIDQGRKS